MIRIHAAMLAFMLGLSAAEAESFAGRIADGLPWSTKTATGANMRMTLNPDGSGRMEVGIMNRRISWQEQGAAICLAGLPGGATRCIAFSPVEGGFAGVGPEGQAFVLRR